MTIEQFNLKELKESRLYKWEEKFNTLAHEYSILKRDMDYFFKLTLQLCYDKEKLLEMVVKLGGDISAFDTNTPAEVEAYKKRKHRKKKGEE